MENKVVLITGASSGLGKAMALHFAEIGYKKLVLVARREELLKKVAEQCRGLGATETVFLVKDLLDFPKCQEVIEETVQKMGRLDVLIGNAGSGKLATVRDLTLEDFQFCLDLNVTANFLLTKYALPYLEKTKGNIVYISSVAGEAPVMPVGAGYNSAKAAINQFAKSVALEEAPKGIRVNVVSPGAVTVEHSVQRAGKNPDSETETQAVRDMGKDWQPLGRVGLPSEIAKLVAFLVSDDNTFMTGSVVKCDGGLTLAGYDKMAPVFESFKNKL